MKNLLISVFVLIPLLYSCEKPPIDDINKDKQQKEPDKDDFSFSLEVKFPNKIAAVRTGDIVWLDIKIKDDDPEENIVYHFMPIGNDASKHQRFKTDFILQKDSRKRVDKFPDMPQADQGINKAIITRDILKETCFGVSPKVPGTFRLNFGMVKHDTLRKEDISPIITAELIFNAVSFSFESPCWMSKWNLFDRWKRWKRQFKVKIDDGDREHDNYLQRANIVKDIEYLAKYDNQQKQGSFQEGVWFEYRETIEWEGTYPSADKFPATVDITIIQHLSNDTRNIIEYKNVPVKL